MAKQGRVDEATFRKILRVAPYVLALAFISFMWFHIGKQARYFATHAPPTVGKLSGELAQLRSQLGASSMSAPKPFRKWAYVSVSQRLRLESPATADHALGRLSLAGWTPIGLGRANLFCKGDLVLKVYGQWAKEPIVSVQWGSPSACPRSPFERALGPSDKR